MVGFYDASAYIGAAELVIESIPTMPTRIELVRFAGSKYTEIKVLEVGVAMGTYFIWSDNTEPFTVVVQYSIMTADGTSERHVGKVAQEVSNTVATVSTTIAMGISVEQRLK